MGLHSGVGPVISTISSANGLNLLQRYSLASDYLKLQLYLPDVSESDPTAVAFLVLANEIADGVNQASPDWTSLASLGVQQATAVAALPGISVVANAAANTISAWLQDPSGN